jgi:hypothetical protein
MPTMADSSNYNRRQEDDEDEEDIDDTVLNLHSLSRISKTNYIAGLQNYQRCCTVRH